MAISHRAFDAEVAPRGVLPLLVRTENNSRADYIVRRKENHCGGE
jgi:hypothetical protein